MKKEKTKIMTPDEFLNKMKEFNKNYSDDPESLHGFGDQLMIDILSSLGYSDGCNEFLSWNIWYA